MQSSGLYEITHRCILVLIGKIRYNMIVLSTISSRSKEGSFDPLRSCNFLDRLSSRKPSIQDTSHQTVILFFLLSSLASSSFSPAPSSCLSLVATLDIMASLVIPAAFFTSSCSWTAQHENEFCMKRWEEAPDPWPRCACHISQLK